MGGMEVTARGIQGHFWHSECRSIIPEFINGEEGYGVVGRTAMQLVSELAAVAALKVCTAKR